MADICSVENCLMPHRALGYCEMHYRRVKRHGDPSMRLKAIGEARRYFREVVLKYDADECLVWPFSRTIDGYGEMNDGAGSTIVSRRVCEEVNGPPPARSWQAAHSCGNGHLGCVAKRHLSWKTPKGNQADRLLHGTLLRGSRHGGSKLKESEVRDIRSSLGKERHEDIAQRFGVSAKTIGSISRGTTWAWLP